jgi:hypothetical protein
MNELQLNRLVTQQFTIERAKPKYDTKCIGHVKLKTAKNDVISQFFIRFIDG